MPITQDFFWQMVGLLLAFMACLGTFGKLLLSMINKSIAEKFAAQEKAREEGAKALRETIDRYMAQGEATSKQLAQLEKDFLNWKAQVPVEYVRREDYIRGQAVLEAKLDGLYAKLEVVQMKGARND